MGSTLHVEELEARWLLNAGSFAPDYAPRQQPGDARAMWQSAWDDGGPAPQAGFAGRFDQNLGRTQDAGRGAPPSSEFPSSPPPFHVDAIEMEFTPAAAVQLTPPRAAPPPQVFTDLGPVQVEFVFNSVAPGFKAAHAGLGPNGPAPGLTATTSVPKISSADGERISTEAADGALAKLAMNIASDARGVVALSVPVESQRAFDVFANNDDDVDGFDGPAPSSQVPDGRPADLGRIPDSVPYEQDAAPLPSFDWLSTEPALDMAALDDGIRHFLDQLGAHGRALLPTQAEAALSPWLLVGAAALTACEIGRRQLRRKDTSRSAATLLLRGGLTLPHHE